MALVLGAAAGGLLVGLALDVLSRRPARGRARVIGPLCAAALCAIVAAVRHHDGAQMALGLVLVAFLVPLTRIDLELRLLPDRLTAPAAALAIALGVALDPGGEVERLLAGAAAFAFFRAAMLVRPDGMGGGDVKLAGVLGLFLGREVAVAVFFALLAGLLAGVAIMARKGVAAGRRTAVPFGPFLALGALVALLAGEDLVDAYLDMT
jgi:leader peptidase (prepilin peptidase) / N-methyltransferase